MKKRRLTFEFLQGYLTVGFFAFLIVALVSSQMVRYYLLDVHSRQLYDEANYLAASCRGYTGGDEFNEEPLKERMNVLSSDFSCSALVLTTSGTIVYDSERSRTGTQVADFDPIKSRSPIYWTDSFYGVYPSLRMLVLSPITGGLRTYGYLVLSRPLSDVLADQDRILASVYVGFLILYVISFHIFALYRRLVGKPLKEITKAVAEYADGNLMYRFEVESRDEMGKLADTLNYMAFELANAEVSQRKFISNISHDFRSPLTSIKGYLEAMLDGTIPPEMYEKYLHVVLSETERLTKLTSSTLAIQSLEANGTLLELEDFDINQVIKDTALTFEGICTRRKIVLDLTFSAEQMPVNADKTKIQQVLYNLIDNAIKFSKEGSTIWIEVYDRYEKVFVSVKDHGCGIPKESLKKVWTRFYKEDSSRGRDKTGTGLGLAICRDIITAHNQNIDVISTEGVGSEFIFTLNRAVAKQ